MTKSKKLVWPTTIVAGLLVIAIFFKAQILSHGLMGFGDPYDGLIALSIVHHWYNFFHGIEGWQTVGYFYPYVNTLGYNDGYFLYGVLYTFFRAFDINMFLSLELSSATIRLIGFYAFFYLAYRQLHLKFWPCLLGATLFSLSSTVIIGGHIQILSVSLAPLLTVFLIHYFNALLVQQNTARAIFWGSLASVLYASWLLSAYYMAWFYTFFAVIFLAWISFYQYRYHFFRLNKPSLWGLLVPLTVMLVALIPFLVTYLPIVIQNGTQPYDPEVRAYLPKIIDFIDFGNQNLIWGKWLSHLHLPVGEDVVGFPLIFLAIFMIAVIQVIRGQPDGKFVYLRPLTYAIVFSLVITLSFHGKALWWFVWNYFPGAKGLRVVARYWIFLVFPMSLLISYFFSTYVAKSRMGQSFLLLIALLLVLEQGTPPTSIYDHTPDQAFIDASKSIPASCRVFYVTGTRHDLPAFLTCYFNNVDAMLISEVTGVRTINGYSTFTPHDWDFRYYPQETYLDRINTYLKKYQITDGVCVLDINKMQWNFSKSNTRG
jgi:hypothetical protein